MFNYKALKVYRQKSGLTQSKLAELLNKDQQAISQWERGDRIPSKDAIPIIANVINAPMSELDISVDNVIDIIEDFNKELYKARLRDLQEFITGLTEKINSKRSDLLTITIDAFVGEISNGETEIESNSDVIIDEIQTIIINAKDEYVNGDMRSATSK